MCFLVGDKYAIQDIPVFRYRLFIFGGLPGVVLHKAYTISLTESKVLVYLIITYLSCCPYSPFPRTRGRNQTYIYI